MLNAGLVLFIAASLVVAVAPTFPVLIASRTLQGIGAAMFMATILATAVSAFPSGQRGRVLGLVSSIVAAGTLLGPPLGGLLTDAFGWRSIFLINLPIGLLGAVGTFVFVPAVPGTGGGVRALDLPGAVLFAAAVTALLLGLGRGPATGSMPPDAVALLAGIGRGAGPVRALGAPDTAAADRPARCCAGECSASGSWPRSSTSRCSPSRRSSSRCTSRRCSAGRPSTTGLVMTLQAVAMLVVSPLSGWWSDRAGSRLPALTALASSGGEPAGGGVPRRRPAGVGHRRPARAAGRRPGHVQLAQQLGDHGRRRPRADRHRQRRHLDHPQPRPGGRRRGRRDRLPGVRRDVGDGRTCRPETFLAGFRGVLFIGAALAVAALVAVAFMHRRGAPAPTPIRVTASSRISALVPKLSRTCPPPGAEPRAGLQRHPAALEEQLARARRRRRARGSPARPGRWPPAGAQRTRGQPLGQQLAELGAAAVEGQQQPVEPARRRR